MESWHRGFQAIIGNPPYLEYSKVRDDYKVTQFNTLPCGNLYGFFAERSEALRQPDGLLSFIVPLSMVSTPNMQTVMEVLDTAYRQIWISYYSNRPDQLFEGAQNFLAIYIGSSFDGPNIKRTSGLRRWPSQLRDLIFETLDYASVDITKRYRLYAYPKFQTDIDQRIWNKLSALTGRLSDFASHQFSSGALAVYCYGGVYWTKARNFSSFVERNGKKAVSTADRPFRVRDGTTPEAVVAVLNSTIHFWFWVNFSDCRNKTYNVILDFPMSDKLISNKKLDSLGRSLMDDYKQNSQRKIRDGRSRTVFTEFYPKMSKTLIDEIDREIGDFIGLTPDELDYLVNYDIKYRMGADEDDAE